MAISKSNTQVTWSSANSKSVASSSNETSDAHTFSSNSVTAMITIKADHGGTPASGDTLIFFCFILLEIQMQRVQMNMILLDTVCI